MAFHKIIVTTPSGKEEVIELGVDYEDVRPFKDEFVTFRGRKYEVKQVESGFDKNGIDEIILTLYNKED